MVDNNRREVLRDVGIAIGGISLAGCLGGDENENSTDTSQATDPGTSTSTEESDTTTEEQETTEPDRDASSNLFSYVPASAEVREVSGYDGDGVAAVTQGFPAQIADTVGSEVASDYEEEEKIVPRGWADVPLDGIEEKMIIGVDALGTFDVYKLDGDYSDSFDDSMEKRQVMGDFDLYVGENSMENTVVALHNSDVLVSFGGDDTQRVRDVMETVADAAAGDAARYQDINSYGEIMDELSYKDVMAGGPTPNEDAFGMGRRLDFNSDSYTIENVQISEQGSINVSSSEERGLDEFPVYVRF